MEGHSLSLVSLEEARERYFTRAERKYEREVAALYRKSLDKIRAEMSRIYDKYAVDGVLTKVEMTRYNRLATLEQNVLASLSPAVRKSIKTIDRLKPEEYGQAFFRTAHAIEGGARVALTWGPLDKDAIRANLDNVFYQTSTERLTQTLKGAVRNTINNGLALGQSYPEMMKDIKDLVNLKNFETMRILRTELHDAQEAGTADSYDAALEQGVNGKVVWIATLDGKTRDTHQEMDGVERDEDGYFHGSIGKAEYPGDPNLPAAERCNCRCTTRFEIEGFAPEIRRSREDGLIPQQTYKEWKEDHPAFETEKLNKPLSEPALIEFKPFESIDDANDYFKQAFDTDDVRFKNMDLGVLEQFRTGADKMLKEFPELKGQIDVVRETKTSKIAGRYTFSLDQTNPIRELELSANETLGGNLSTYQARLANDGITKLHFVGYSPESIATHELAHTVQDMLVQKSMGISKLTNMTFEMQESFSARWNSGYVTKDIAQKAYEKLGMSAVPRTAAEARAHYAAVEKLGKYSLTNSNELHAEAIANALTSDNPLPFSIEVLKITKERMAL